MASGNVFTAPSRASEREVTPANGVRFLDDVYQEASAASGMSWATLTTSQTVFFSHAEQTLPRSDANRDILVRVEASSDEQDDLLVSTKLLHWPRKRAATFSIATLRGTHRQISGLVLPLLFVDRAERRRRNRRVRRLRR